MCILCICLTWSMLFSATLEVIDQENTDTSIDRNTDDAASEWIARQVIVLICGLIISIMKLTLKSLTVCCCLQDKNTQCRRMCLCFGRTLLYIVLVSNIIIIAATVFALEEVHNAGAFLSKSIAFLIVGWIITEPFLFLLKFCCSYNKEKNRVNKNLCVNMNHVQYIEYQEIMDNKQNPMNQRFQ